MTSEELKEKYKALQAKYKNKCAKVKQLNSKIKQLTEKGDSSINVGRCWLRRLELTYDLLSNLTSHLPTYFCDITYEYVGQPYRANKVECFLERYAVNSLLIHLAKNEEISHIYTYEIKILSIVPSKP